MQVRVGMKPFAVSKKLPAGTIAGAVYPIRIPY